MNLCFLYVIRDFFHSIREGIIEASADTRTLQIPRTLFEGTVQLTSINPQSRCYTSYKIRALRCRPNDTVIFGHSSGIFVACYLYTHVCFEQSADGSCATNMSNKEKITHQTLSANCLVWWVSCLSAASRFSLSLRKAIQQRTLTVWEKAVRMPLRNVGMLPKHLFHYTPLKYLRQV